MNTDEQQAAEAACMRLIHLYTILTDEARWQEIAALYIEDGIMIRPTATDAPVVGRAAILAALTARLPRVTRHICANIVVDVATPTTASATSTMLLFVGSQADDGGLPIRAATPPLIGGFRDRLIRTPLGWRFVERAGHLAFRLV